MSTERLDALLRSIVGPYVPHRPTPAQLRALLDPSDEILYGGAAGGGKTDWLLMEALRWVHIPGYSALLMRRTYRQLANPKGLIHRSKEWLKSTDAEWSQERHTWTFPSSATLTFGAMEREDDRFNWDGPDFQLVGFDEARHFTLTQYTYMFSRIRRPSDIGGAPLSAVPLRMLAASNPSRNWLKDRFALPDKAVRDRVSHTYTDVDAHVRTRTFLPARLQDNPHLDQGEYVASLRELHPFERQQLLDGDWGARPGGGRFLREWFRIIDAMPACASDFRYWDLASTEPHPDNPDPDWTAGVRMGRSREPRYVIPHVDRFRKGPGAVEARIEQRTKLDGRRVTQVLEQEPGASGKLATRAISLRIASYPVVYVRPTGDKALRADPLAAAAERGEVDLVAGPWVEPFLQEAEAFTGGDGDGHDDQVDGASGAYAKCALRGTVSLDDLYPAPAEATA